MELKFHLMKIGEVTQLEVTPLGQSVARLNALVRKPRLGFAGIQGRLSMPKSPAHQLIPTMCELSLIKRISLGGRCMPGHRGQPRYRP